MGLSTGQAATQNLLKFGQTEWSWKGPRPTNGFFNLKADRYVYTKNGGWIDMSHFMFYAAKALESKINGDKNPVGESVQMGFLQEAADTLFARHSAYSYEDLPTDKAAAVFAATVFDPNSKKTLGEQVENYLNNLGGTEPSNAPNYSQLPKNDEAVRRQGKPSAQNTSTKPMYTSPAGN